MPGSRSVERSSGSSVSGSSRQNRENPEMNYPFPSPYAQEHERGYYPDGSRVRTSSRHGRRYEEPDWAHPGHHRQSSHEWSSIERPNSSVEYWHNLEEGGGWSNHATNEDDRYNPNGSFITSPSYREGRIRDSGEPEWVTRTSDEMHQRRRWFDAYPDYGRESSSASRLDQYDEAELDDDAIHASRDANNRRRGRRNDRGSL